MIIVRKFLHNDQQLTFSLSRVNSRIGITSWIGKGFTTDSLKNANIFFEIAY